MIAYYVKRETNFLPAYLVKMEHYMTSRPKIIINIPFHQSRRYEFRKPHLVVSRRLCCTREFGKLIPEPLDRTQRTTQTQKSVFSEKNIWKTQNIRSDKKYVQKALKCRKTY